MESWKMLLEKRTRHLDVWISSQEALFEEAQRLKGKWLTSGYDIEASIHGPKSVALMDRARTVISPGQFATVLPPGVVLVQGLNGLLFGADGEAYLDWLTSASSVAWGHGHPRILRAVAGTMQDLFNPCTAYHTSEITIRAAEALAEVVPGDWNKHVMFCSDGGNAINALVEISRARAIAQGNPERIEWIVFHGAYHGNQGWASHFTGYGVSNRLTTRREREHFKLFSYPTDPGQMWQVLQLVEAELRRGNTQGIMVEPIQGDGGILLPPKNLLPMLKQLADKYDVMLALDEIQCGAGRTGRFFAHEYTTPPLDCRYMALGKAITGGIVNGSVAIVDAEQDFLLRLEELSTYGGNAAQAAAILTMLEMTNDEDTLMGIRVKGEHLKQECRILCEKYAHAVEFRGVGLFAGIEVRDPDTQVSRAPHVSRWLAEPVDGGIPFLTSQVGHACVRLHPPYNVTIEEIDHFIARTDRCLWLLDNGQYPQALMDECNAMFSALDEQATR